MTRNRESPAAKRLAGEGAEVVVGDFHEQGTLATAMRGMDAVFAMTTFFEEGVEAEVAPVAFMENVHSPQVLDGLRQGVYAAPRREFPDVGWHTFADWARQQDWSALDAG